MAVSFATGTASNQAVLLTPDAVASLFHCIYDANDRTVELALQLLDQCIPPGTAPEQNVPCIARSADSNVIGPQDRTVELVGDTGAKRLIAFLSSNNSRFVEHAAGLLEKCSTQCTFSCECDIHPHSCEALTRCHTQCNAMRCAIICADCSACG